MTKKRENSDNVEEELSLSRFFPARTEWSGDEAGFVLAGLFLSVAVFGLIYELIKLVSLKMAVLATAAQYF